MQLPLTERRAEEATDRSSTSDGGRSSGPGLLRLILLAVAVVGLVYLASRRTGTGGGLPMVDDAREKVEEIRPGGGRGDEDEGETAEVEPDEPAAVGEAADEVSRSEDEGAVAGTDRTAQEIAERSEEDVEETPADPGEMTIDEEVADEVIGDESETEGADTDEDEEEEEEEE